MRMIEFPRRPHAGAAHGFTLIEVLIVISIIAILASLVISGLGMAQKRADMTLASTEVTMLLDALANYRFDEGAYPGFGLPSDPERNDFPLLFDALMDAPRPRGKGGRSAPYLDRIAWEKIVVENESGGGYRQATRKERYDSSIRRYIADSWGQPYIYRCNVGLPRQDYMIDPDGVDVYSIGPDGVNDTILGHEGEQNDDISIRSGA